MKHPVPVKRRFKSTKKESRKLHGLISANTGDPRADMAWYQNVHLNDRPLTQDPDVYWKARIGPLDDDWLHQETAKMSTKLKANAFSDEVCSWLSNRSRFGQNVAWHANHRLDSQGRDFVDVVGILKGAEHPKILIEIELHREDPVSNVTKIFKWAKSRHQTGLVVFHAFSKLYKTRKTERRKRAIFLGRMFEKDRKCQYIPLNLKYSPRAGGRYGAGRRTHAAELLGRRIMERILRKNLVPHA
jgi:hypothetical protein